VKGVICMQRELVKEIKWTDLKAWEVLTTLPRYEIEVDGDKKIVRVFKIKD